MKSSPCSTTETWSFPGDLTSAVIEDWVANLQPSVKSVTIRLNRWKNSGPSADASLQSVLCLLHRRKIETRVQVPPGTLKGRRASIAFDPPDPAKATEKLTRVESHLAHSVAGLAVGQLCSFDRENVAIPVNQRTWLKRRNYLCGRGNEYAMAIPTGIDSSNIPEAPAKSGKQRLGEFNKRLKTLLHDAGLNTREYLDSVPRIYRALETFAFEAVENTFDHGRRDFRNTPIRSLRFAKLRRLDLRSQLFRSQHLTSETEESFNLYLKSLKPTHYTSSLRSGGHRRLMELTIADGGVGIAANMAGGFHVFNESIEEERRQLLKALLPNSSTKNDSQPGRGQGLTKMLRACNDLSGFLTIRTGRISAFRYYPTNSECRKTIDFNDELSDAYVLNFTNSELPLTAGTSVSLIIPI